MSSSETTLNTGSQAITNYDYSKIFIWDNRYRNETLINSLYDPWVLKAGTVMGRILGTDYVVPCSDDATDGSQDPIGILAVDITVEDGVEVTIPICVAGDVAQEKVVLLDPLTLEYSITVGGLSKRMKDAIQTNTRIHLVSANENTIKDNQ